MVVTFRMTSFERLFQHRRTELAPKQATRNWKPSFLLWTLRLYVKWTSNDPSVTFLAGPSLSYLKNAPKQFWLIPTTKTLSCKSVKHGGIWVLELNILLWYIMKIGREPMMTTWSIMMTRPPPNAKVDKIVPSTNESRE